MPKVIEFVCLANSRKISGRCIAGKVVNDGQILHWIRPVSNRDSRELNEEERGFKDGSGPQLLDVILLPYVKKLPSIYQIENLLINDKYYWLKTGRIAKKDLKNYVDHGPLPWTNPDSSSTRINDRYNPANLKKSDGSLRLIFVNKVLMHVGPKYPPYNNKRYVTASFIYDDMTYCLPVTDPQAEYNFLKSDDGDYILKNVYMCISIGEPFDRDGMAYSFVASVLC